MEVDEELLGEDLQKCARYLEDQFAGYTLSEARAFEVLERERRLSQSGELQAGSNIGKGQLAAADYVLRPEIIVSDTDSGGIGGALGGLVGSIRLARSAVWSARWPAACKRLGCADA